MPNYDILAWQPLIRPPHAGDEPPVLPDTPLKALACRNQVTSVIALVTADQPVRSARLSVSDLICGAGIIPASCARVRLVGSVQTPEAGLVSDALYDVDEFPLERSAALHISIAVPKGIPAGEYRGSVALEADGALVAESGIELEVANADLPDVHDWEFSLNVWMNPATVARWHGVEVWSDEHFRLMRPYVEDLASHGQKTAVVPICYQPWGTQTRDPFPNSIRWTRRGDDWDYDFSAFDRLVRLYEECGIDRAIHCYTIAPTGGDGESCSFVYTDADTGREERIDTKTGDEQYTRLWSGFFDVFREHLAENGWLAKTYIGFDERSPEVMQKVVAFLDEYAPEFKTALAGNARRELVSRLDDLSVQVSFSDRGIADMVPPERATMGMAELLDPGNICSITKRCPEKMLTTFYVCCGPAFPNTFVHSPLVESRMLPFLAAQGGYDGFLRWSYNDWTDDPYQHPEWGTWPTGDVFFVYPGENGPVSSLRWEQLMEGICDYELARIASANLRTPDEMVDYEQAITLACRSVDGHAKAVGDIEIARRLLIPIAEHQNEG